MLGEPFTAQLQALGSARGLHCVAAPLMLHQGKDASWALQVKERAIDKGKWSGRARPRTSPSQVCPACLPLRPRLLQKTGSEDQSTVSAPPGAWGLLTAVPAAS